LDGTDELVGRKHLTAPYNEMGGDEQNDGARGTSDCIGAVERFAHDVFEEWTIPNRNGHRGPLF